MSTKAQELKIRLFLEGIEIPVISATVNCVLTAPASAQIQIVYTSEAHKIKPRTLTHLFFLESSGESTEYKLLFCGEVSGISISKTEGSRSCTLSCQDFRSYFNIAYAYYGTTSDINQTNSPNENLIGLTRSKAAFVGATTGFNQLVGNDLQTLISHTLMNPTPSSIGFRGCSGLLGGVLKTIETFTGLSNRTSPGINQFFSFNEARLKLLAQIGIYPKDTTASKLLDSKTVLDFISKRMDSLGQLVTLNQIINFLLGFIYYKTIPCTSPRYLSESTTVQSSTVPNRIKQTASELLVKLEKVKINLTSILKLTEPILDAASTEAVVKALRSLEDLLPKNALFIEQATTSVKSKGQKDVDAKKTKYEQYLDSRDFSSIVSLGANDLALINLYVAIQEAETTSKDEGAAQIRLMESLNTSSVNITTNLVEGIKVGRSESIVSNNTVSYPKGLRRTEVVSLFNKVSNAVNTVNRVKETETFTADVNVSSRLMTTLMVPDLFFGVAPTCNVLFPDMYFSISYNRSMLSEPTRLHLTTDLDTTLGDTQGIAGKEIYYAPSIENLKEQQSVALVVQQGQDTQPTGKLFDHELFTGIVPTFSSMNRLAHANALQNGVTGRVQPDTLKDFYLRIANYKFLQTRLSKRALNASGIFNPYAVTGFPMIVIDRAKGNTAAEVTGKINQADIQDLEQYIGLCVSISHTINQQGGTTSYQLQYARPHRGKDDPFIFNMAFNGEVVPSYESETFSFEEIKGKIFNSIRNFRLGTDSQDTLDRSVKLLRVYLE
ncbi:MAG: hypothetical protein CL678_15345 [Bdellovibrionaceae bacterium]|nr:hypothetical protein [Pseudobdellovibrionaceae bacterium]